MEVKTSLIKIFALVAMVAATVLPASAARRHDSAADADRRKADYLFLEAKRQSLQQRHDAYFELMDYARHLNPDDKTLGMYLGIYYLQLDSAGASRGFDLMGDYVDANPDDLYNGYSYAAIAQHLGCTDRATEILRRLHYRYPEREGVAYKYADMLRRSGDPVRMREALCVYDTLAMAGGDPVEMAGLRTSVYYQLGDTAAIVAETQRLLESSPQNSNYNVYAGNVYHSLLHSDSAIVYYDRAVELDPSNGAAYYTRASYYNELNDSAAYDREVFDALRQPDLDVNVKLALMHDYVAKLYTDSLQQPRITELFTTLAAQHPHQVELRNLYADYLIAVGDWSGAAEQVSMALDLEPSDQRRWRTLASLYLQMQRFNATVEAASRGLHYFPNDADLYQLEAIGYTGAGQYDKAAAIYDNAIAMVLSDSVAVDREVLSDLYTGRGDVANRENDASGAIACYMKALDENPENLVALNNVAYNMACEGEQLDRALRMIEKVVAAKPDDPTSLDTYAWVLFKLKQYDKARQTIDRAFEGEPEPSAEMYEHAGDIYFMDGSPDEAVAMWRKALELDPDNNLLRRKVSHKTYFYK